MFYKDVVRQLGDRCPELRTRSGSYVIQFVVSHGIAWGTAMKFELWCRKAGPLGCGFGAGSACGLG